MGKSQRTARHLETSHLMDVVPDIAKSVLDKSVYYYNATGAGIVVKDRSDIGHSLPAISSFKCEHYGSLVVTVEYRFRGGVNSNIEKPYSEDYESTYDQQLRQKLHADLLRPDVGGFGTRQENRARVSYEITLESIERLGGAIYIPKLDLLVYTTDNHLNQLSFNRYHHPYSDAGNNRRFAMTVDEALRGNAMSRSKGVIDDCTIYAVRLVDNTQKTNARYVNIHNEVYRIKAVQDEHVESGLYVYRSIPVTDGVDDYRTESYSKTLEEIDKETSDLYKTREEASYHGDPERSQKRAIEEKSREFTIREQELKNKKLMFENEKLELQRAHDKEKLQFEKELDQYKNDNARKTEEIKRMEEQARQRQKEEHERRAYQRKDFNDTLKFVTVFVTTVGSLAYAYTKTTSK